MAEMFRMASFPSLAEFYRYATDDVVTKGAPGLADLGIEPMTLQKVGIRTLRRYRRHIYHDDIVEER